MASKAKHTARSRRSSHDTIPTQMFVNKAAIRQVKKDKEGFFQKLLNRTTNK